jgi:hypothetical protein
VLAVLAVLAVAQREAAGMGAVVGPSGEQVSVARARVVVAVAEGRTTRWAQISLAPSHPSFAWLVPVMPGARIDLASDAWLDALDAATAPVVLPPSGTAQCSRAVLPQVLTPATSPSSVRPEQATVALDLTSLTSAVSTLGFSIAPSLLETLGDVFSSGGAILALVYGGGDGTCVRSLRIVDTGRPEFSFALTGSSAGSVEVTAFAIAGGAEQIGTAPLVFPTRDLVWLADGGSNYASEAARLLSSGWLLQSSEASAFFRPTTIASGLTEPAVVSDYYALASSYGDTVADPQACDTAAELTIDQTPPYAPACPAGALAIVPGPSPCTPSAAVVQTPYEALVCGGAIDAALAVASLSPSNVWVTRWAGVVTAASASNLPLLAGSTQPIGLVLTAGSDKACRTPNAFSEADADFPDGGWEGEDGGRDDGEEWSGVDGGVEFDGEGVGAGSGYGDSGDEAIGTSIGPNDGDASAAAAVALTAGGAEGGVGDIVADAASSTDGCGSSQSEDASGDGCGGAASESGDDRCSSTAANSGDSGGCSGNGNGNCASARHGHRTRSPVSRAILFAIVALGVLRRRERHLPRAAERVRRAAFTLAEVDSASPRDYGRTDDGPTSSPRHRGPHIRGARRGKGITG